MRQSLAACAALGIIGAARVHATDISGEVGIGAIYSDNIRSAATNTQSDTIGIATTDFAVFAQ